VGKQAMVQKYEEFMKRPRKRQRKEEKKEKNKKMI